MDKQYFNYIQSYVLAMMPKDFIGEMGRGTGKGAIEAGRMKYCMQHMPGSSLAMVAPSVKRCLTNILPSALIHFENWGYKRDIHYTVGKKPWKGLHWKTPRFTPDSWDNTVAFYNGTVLNIISQDRPGTSNSMSLDHIFVDEAKFVDWEQLNNETFPANRGNNSVFGDCPLHHGLTITSDTPTTKKGSWFLSYADKQDPELIRALEAILARIYKIEEKLIKHPERYEYYQSRLTYYNNLLNKFRSDCLLYKRCSSIQNIAVLGIEYIKKMKRDLPPLTFDTAIMCKHINIAADGFYSGMVESVNLYTAPNISYLDGLNFKIGDKQDCRMDADVVPDKPLIIAFDANANINCLTVGQVGDDNKLRAVRSMYVKYERKLLELCDDFNAYFKYQRNKNIVFYFDSTFVGNNYGINSFDFHKQIKNHLIGLGWFVDDVYIGAPMSHLEKQELINRMFRGRAKHQVLINKDNCEDLIISLENAGVYNNGKDKRGEKLVETDEDPLESRTDFSDSFDTMCIGVEKFPRFQIDLGNVSNVYPNS